MIHELGIPGRVTANGDWSPYDPSLIFAISHGIPQSEEPYTLHFGVGAQLRARLSLFCTPLHKSVVPFTSGNGMLTVL
jgi:hypothetical protein